MRFSRFASVGALCALLSNILVIAFAHYGFGYLVASLLAFGPVLLVGYALHTTITFKTTSSYLSFFKYTVAMAVNVPLWIGALWIFCDLFNSPVAIAAPTTTALIFLWNYLSAKWALVAAAEPVQARAKG
jgi:putative flippase GtrA